MKETMIKKQYVPLALDVAHFENGDILTFSRDGFHNAWDDLQNDFGN